MQNKYDSNSRSAIISSGIVLSIAMIMTLPLCGLFFDCGCTWLWTEMDDNCNIHDLEKTYKCPWCQSMISAIISIGLSASAAVWAIYYYRPFDAINQKSSGESISLSIVLGLSVFFIIAFFTAWASAFYQNYPYFLL